SQKAIISQRFNSAIRPFAQTDVIDTILSGVAPHLEATFLGNFEMFLNKYNSHLISQTKNPSLQKQIEGIDTSALVKAYLEEIQRIKTNHHLIPLMNAVSSLSKED